MPGRLGIDVGRSGADLLLLDGASGRTHSLKISAGADDMAGALGRGIAELAHAAGIQPGEIDTVVHGSSVPNDLARPADVRVGLLVTRGFEHILHMGRGRTTGRGASRPPAIVGPGLTRGVLERMSAHGDAITQLDEADARQAMGQLLQAGAEIVAICLVNAHVNPAHELLLREIAFEVNEKVPVVLSHEVAPEAGEYERALAAAMDAGARRRQRSHRETVDAGLRAAGIGPRTFAALSTGGRASAGSSADSPVRTGGAGRAGVAAAAARIASLAGFPDAVMLDIGGGATDIALIRGGMARIANETAVDGDFIRVPSLDVRRVGAGAGSTARWPVAGMIRVGRGGGDGAAPTVRDASVVLGRLSAARLGMDAEAAAERVAAFGRRHGLDRHRAAEGIVEVFEEETAGALRLAAIEKGEDPARMAVVACGGAGPLHACAVAALAGCAAVVVPPNAGVLSALGFALAGRSTQFAQGIGRTLEDLRPQDLADIVGRLGARAQAWLDEEGVPGDVTWRADLRYFRRHFQMSAELDPAWLSDGAGLQRLADRLAEGHHRRFGVKPDRPVEIVALRAIAAADEGAIAPARFQRGGANPKAALVEQVQVRFGGGFVATSVYDRDRLTAGNRVSGPALVLQSDATTVIPPRHSGEVDDFLNIVVRPDGGASAAGH